MTTSNRPNYFILLDIDPKKPWSDAEFQKALKAKQDEWNKKANHPTKGAEFRKNRDMIPNIQSLMGDETKRKQEAEAAIKIQKERGKEGKEEFSQALKLFTIKGFITENEIAQLLKQYSEFTNENSLRKELSNKGIKIREVTTDKTDENDVISSSVMKSIKIELDIIQKKDLYDFLLPKSSRTSDLLAKAQEIYTKLQQYGEKTSEVTAQQKLTGHAITIFKNNTERTKYDRALAKEAYSILEQQITQLGDRPDKIIYAAEFTYLLEIARKKGLDVDKAKNYIHQTALTKKLSVELGGVESVNQKLQCSNCDHLNDKNREFCTQCNAPLKVTCPKCQQVVPTEERSCRCSFPIGNAPSVRNLIAQSQRLISEKNFGEAILNLEYASQQWNTIPPIELRDELTQAIEKRRHEAQGYQQQQKTVENQLIQAIQSRCFYEARTLRYRLQSDFPYACVPAESSIIEAAIQQAETALSRVRAAKVEPEEAIARYQEILQICQDCQLARDALAKTPPPPPTHLKAKISNGLVSLNWQSSPAKNVNYTIVRKYNSRPISSNDGESLATIAGLHYDDTKCAVGIPIYYAIYTSREGVLSTSAALLDVPVIVVGEITNLIKQVSNQQVNLQWNPPENAVEVRVIRNHRCPHHQDDGEVVQVLHKSQVSDRNLQNGITYHYGIYAIFHDYEGKQRASQGVLIEAVPEEPPTVPKIQMEVINQGGKRHLKLYWQPLNKGQFAILKSLKPIELGHDPVLPENRLAQFGELLISKSNNEVITPIQDMGVVYFIPVVIFQSTAYLGETIPYTNIEEISNLKVQRQTNALHFYWDWPKNCQQSILAYSHVKFPTDPNAANVTHYQVTRGEYDSRGYYSITIPEKQTDLQDYFIVVFAVIQSNGQNITSPGLSSSARFRVCCQSQMILNYEIEKKRTFWKLLQKEQPNFLLKISATGMLPNLIVVSKQNTIPLNKHDGKSVLKIPAQEIEKSNTVLSFSLEDSQPGYIRLFLEDDSLYDSQGGYIRIYHPANEKLKIN